MHTDKGIVSARTAIWGMACLVCLVLLPLGAAAQKTPQTKSGFVTTPDGVRIHYLEAGKGPALLFVPGWTMPADIWEQQITYFSRTHRVVAMDPRSQGLSSQTTEGHYPEARARDIKAVVDQLKLAPVVLVGWSMGVMEAVGYVDQFGNDTLAGLVLVDGFVFGDPELPVLKAYFGFISGFQKNRKTATEAFVHSMYKRPQSPAYLKRITAASLRTPTHVAMALMMGAISVNRQAALDKIRTPTLIIGAQSPYAGRYEEMQKHIADSRLEIMENVGHALFVDDAEGFNARVAEFLQQIRH